MSSIHLSADVAARGVDIQFDADDGETVAVLGPNGAGKSTLLSLIAGLIRPDTGRVVLGPDVVTNTSTGTFVPAHARGVASLTQKPLLFPHLSVEANVAFAPRSRGAGRRQAHTTARTWLGAVDALELADRRPRGLSGGQAQRVAIARALAADPRVLLLDEPMAALDIDTAPAVRRLLRTVLREQRRTAVVVTHDLLDALALADTVVVVEKGRIVERGPTTEVLTAPRSAFAARIAGVNLVAGTADSAGSLTTAWGSTVHGHGESVAGGAVAVFAPSSVAAHIEAPHASPRNVFPVTIAEMDVHGATVRLRAAKHSDGSPGIAADVTPAAVAELHLEPGMDVFFVVKSQEVTIHPASR
ncbi:ATP-binding cassette domain-containing protein [Rhodococcus sp. 14-2470-1a]|uniref:sulfate/molybdate ABC transporter ATP-binding protein n=1 Tax=Rhodococcus sp. 14-2470-1a TaxID=2023150 RepID=UPI0015C5B7E4